MNSPNAGCEYVLKEPAKGMAQHQSQKNGSVYAATQLSKSGKWGTAIFPYHYHGHILKNHLCWCFSKCELGPTKFPEPISGGYP